MRSEPSNAPKILHKALPQARGDTHKQAEAVWDQAILENSVCSSKVTKPGEHKQNRKLQLARAAPLTEFLEFWVSFWHLTIGHVPNDSGSDGPTPFMLWTQDIKFTRNFQET